MQEDDNLTAEQATEGVPAESEASEAKAEENTEAVANTETEAGAQTDEQDADGDEDSEEDKPKKPSRYQRLKRDRDALAQEVAELRRRTEAGGQGATDQASIDRLVEAEIGAPPQEKDYPDYLAFERAMTAYEAAKVLVTREVKRNAQSAQADQERRARELLADYEDYRRDLAKAIPDLEPTLKNANIPVSRVVENLILETGEKGPLIAYHLAKNPAKAADLNAMSPLAAAREIGRLEAKLSLPKPNTTTKAPPPTSPPKGGATPSNPEMELDAWIKKKYGR